MNIRSCWIAAGSVVLLGGCGGGAEPPAANAVAAGNETLANAAVMPDKNESADANAAAPTPPGPDGEVSSGYLVGRWSEDGDCSEFITFNADGSFLFPWGTGGRYTLDGDRLVLEGNSSPLRVRAIELNKMEVRYSGGRIAQSTRC